MNSASTIPLTVVMPAYNEEQGIAEAVRDVERAVLAVVPGAELLVVDDGSRDRTGPILDELAAANARIRVVHKNNGGHGSALIAGLDQARGEYVLLMDSDRQIPIEAFGALWEAARTRDGAFGVRVKRRDPRHRLILTAIVRFAVNTIFGARLRDSNCPFKVFRRRIWEQARPLIPSDTLIPSIFLALYMKQRGMDMVEVEAPHRERETGQATLRFWKLARFCLRAFAQLLAFRRKV